MSIGFFNSRLVPFLLVLLLAMLSAKSWAGALLLDDRTPSIDAWPALTIMKDPAAVLTAEGVLARLNEFTPPTSAYAALGFSKP